MAKDDANAELQQKNTQIKQLAEELEKQAIIRREAKRFAAVSTVAQLKSVDVVLEELKSLRERLER